MTPKIALSTARAHNCSKLAGGKTVKLLNSHFLLRGVRTRQKRKHFSTARRHFPTPRSSRPRVSRPLEKCGVETKAYIGRDREEMLRARTCCPRAALYISRRLASVSPAKRARLIAVANILWPGADTQFSRFNKLVLGF